MIEPLNRSAAVFFSILLILRTFAIDKVGVFAVLDRTFPYASPLFI